MGNVQTFGQSGGSPKHNQKAITLIQIHLNRLYALVGVAVCICLPANPKALCRIFHLKVVAYSLFIQNHKFYIFDSLPMDVKSLAQGTCSPSRDDLWGCHRAHIVFAAGRHERRNVLRHSYRHYSLPQTVLRMPQE